MLDVIIIGMGPAGMSAGVYAKRSGLNTLILEKNAPGGLVNTTNIVDNYLGFDNITGPELSYKMFEHTVNNGVEYKIEEVLDVTKENNLFIVKTNKDTYKSKTVILASGRSPKKLDIENKIKDLHISRCSICDAPLYKDKDVLVIGGGNSALEEGIYLSEFAKKVTIVSKHELKSDEELTNEAKRKSNIIIKENNEVKDIIKNDNNYTVKLKDETMMVDGIFSYIGFIPSENFIEKLNVNNKNGYIITNETETNVEGLFACGDIINKKLYQIITACSEGATASVHAKSYISKMEA